MRLSSPMRAKSPSRPKRTMAHFMYRSGTPGLASHLRTKPDCFRSFSRRTMPSPRRRAAPGWDSLYPSASLRCTAAGFGSSHSLAGALRLLSRSRSSSSGRWRPHEQAHSGGGRPGGQSPDHPRYVGPNRLRDLGGRKREEALAAIAKQRPDLILMDIQLPIMDGYTATKQIKADPALRSIPIIAVTSYALSGEEEKARAAGCDDYVPKPFSPRQLLGKIRQYLS